MSWQISIPSKATPIATVIFAHPTRTERWSARACNASLIGSAIEESMSDWLDHRLRPGAPSFPVSSERVGFFVFSFFIFRFPAVRVPIFFGFIGMAGVLGSPSGIKAGQVFRLCGGCELIPPGNANLPIAAFSTPTPSNSHLHERNVSVTHPLGERPQYPYKKE